MFDLARLCAEARESAFYTDRNGQKVTLFFTHPTPGKLGAAFKAAGVKLDKEGQPIADDGADQLRGIDVASVALAAMCIEHIEGIEAQGPMREQTGFGVGRLSDAWLAAIDRNALYHLGQHLMSATKPSENEGKDLEP